jgi:hypothetical protein
LAACFGHVATDRIWGQTPQFHDQQSALSKGGSIANISLKTKTGYFPVGRKYFLEILEKKEVLESLFFSQIMVELKQDEY